MPRKRKNDVSDEQIVAAYSDCRSGTKVAAMFGIGSTTVHRVLTRAGVDLTGLDEYRQTMGKAKTVPYIGAYKGSREEVTGWYRDGLSMKAIADRIGRSTHVVARIIKKAGIARPFQGSGPDHSGWSGGRLEAEGGYWRIWVAPDDPMALMRNHQGYVLEHRLVMAKQLGRTLSRHETVHHINGDRKDNRPENLQLRHGKHGAGVSHVCLDCGSHNIGTRKLE